MQFFIFSFICIVIGSLIKHICKKENDVEYMAPCFNFNIDLLSNLIISLGIFLFFIGLFNISKI